MELFSIRTKLSLCKVFYRNLLALEMRKTQVLMNKPFYLGFSILGLSKTVEKLWYMDTDSFIVQVKTNDIYK